MTAFDFTQFPRWNKMYAGANYHPSLDPAEVHQVPLRLRGVEVKPYIVNEAPVTGASLYDNGAYVTL